jgi:hypothetical protein
VVCHEDDLAAVAAELAEPVESGTEREPSPLIEDVEPFHP